MSARFVVTGTDTGVGKTVFAAALTDALGAYYWKPIQTGEEKDSETVRQLARLSPDRILPEAGYFPLPASPHLAAATAGVTLRPWALSLPENRPLVIEGAGGLLVPLTRDCVFADVFARWQIPIILCARTTLGTINHTLLSLEAAKHRKIPVLGVAFIGEAQADTQEIIAEMGAVFVLGRLPNLDGITPDSLRCAFHSHFDLAHFQSGVDSLTEGG